jgi:hypothetical protein
MYVCEWAARGKYAQGRQLDSLLRGALDRKKIATLKKNVDRKFVAP